MHAAKVPQHLWYYAVQYATLMRNSIYNNSMKASPGSKVGLLALDAKSVLSFGQQVILHLPETSSKLHITGEKMYGTSSRFRIIWIPDIFTTKT